MTKLVGPIRLEGWRCSYNVLQWENWGGDGVKTNVAARAQRAIEMKLIDGTWSAGMRLPPERELAEALGVSRSSLREAIFVLKARGLLASRQGSGVVVTDSLQAPLNSPWLQMLADHPDVRWDMLEFRREHEGAIAYYAAMRATAQDLERIAVIVRRLDDAYASSDRAGEYAADADFHQAIAEASHNSMFLHLHSRLVRMLREHISLNLSTMHEPGGNVADSLRRQHHGIWDAIRLRQPERARKMMHEHLDYTLAELRRVAERAGD